MQKYLHPPTHTHIHKHTHARSPLPLPPPPQAQLRLGAEREHLQAGHASELEDSRAQLQWERGKMQRAEARAKSSAALLEKQRNSLEGLMTRLVTAKSVSDLSDQTRLLFDVKVQRCLAALCLPLSSTPTPQVALLQPYLPLLHTYPPGGSLASRRDAQTASDSIRTVAARAQPPSNSEFCPTHPCRYCCHPRL